MADIVTEAWVLNAAQGQTGRAELVRRDFSFPDISDEEVLAKPIFGCWEGNMLHAVDRDPIDICRERGEPAVVLGNSGVVQVERVGRRVTNVREGDVCLVFGNSVWDDQGYPIKILAYDAPGTMGVLAKTMKLGQRQLIRVPDGAPFSLKQWAAFSLRYISAWANWRVAYACWKSQMDGVPPQDTYVCGWGGGVSFAQLCLARHFGCRVLMICSNPERIELLRSAGIESLDRTVFDSDSMETGILAAIADWTNGRGVSIFIDNIGAPVHRMTLKALARQGVITTCGWKGGMRTPVARAIECLQRHIHVHTHFARYSEALEAVQFAERTGWLPPSEERVWGWDEIPALLRAYANGTVSSYFPIFSIHPELSAVPRAGEMSTGQASRGPDPSRPEPQP